MILDSLVRVVVTPNPNCVLRAIVRMTSYLRHSCFSWRNVPYRTRFVTPRTSETVLRGRYPSTCKSNVSLVVIHLCVQNRRDSWKLACILRFNPFLHPNLQRRWARNLLPLGYLAPLNQFATWRGEPGSPLHQSIELSGRQDPTCRRSGDHRR